MGPGGPGGPGGGFMGGRGGPGGPGGPGGGDPSRFIEGLDRNGNGMIDPDEMQGPAQFMISRMQREDPSIRTDRPIPLAKFKEAFERMRGGREGGGDSGDQQRRPDNTEALNAALTAATLVPGFGGDAPVLPPVLGFGPAAEMMSVEVTPADLKEAEERLARYDRNKDGFLAGDEISSRWTGNPMDFDRNGDGKLSVSELAIRAARLRVAQASVAATSERRDNGRRREAQPAPVEIEDLYSGRRSFAVTQRGLPEGLPGWFAERDTNGDQQISMAEFASYWTPELVEEFQRFDLNGDGVITPQECLAAIRNGAVASAGSGGGSPMAAASGAPPADASSGRTFGRTSGGSRYGRPSSPPSGSAPTAASSVAPAGGAPDERMLEAAQRIMSRNDKNKDGVLTPDEWKDMLVDPSAADADRDGRITAVEYAQWLQSRSNSR